VQGEKAAPVFSEPPYFMSEIDYFFLGASLTSTFDACMV
jgi:hypothetical protein